MARGIHLRAALVALAWAALPCAGQAVYGSIAGTVTTEARQPVLDLGGDLAAARREARELWLAHRSNAEHAAAPGASGSEREKSTPRIILPGSEHEPK